MHALSPQLTPDEDEGDITITAPIPGGQGSSAVEDANPIQARDCSDSDTSEEESLPLLSTHDAGSQPAQSSTTTSFPEEQSNRPVQASAPGSSAAKTVHTNLRIANLRIRTQKQHLCRLQLLAHLHRRSALQTKKQNVKSSSVVVMRLQRSNKEVPVSLVPVVHVALAVLLPPLPRPANVLASETCSYS